MSSSHSALVVLCFTSVRHYSHVLQTYFASASEKVLMEVQPYRDDAKNKCDAAKCNREQSKLLIGIIDAVVLTSHIVQ